MKLKSIKEFFYCYIVGILVFVQWPIGKGKGGDSFHRFRDSLWDWMVDGQKIYAELGQERKKRCDEPQIDCKSLKKNFILKTKVDEGALLGVYFISTGGWIVTCI